MKTLIAATFVLLGAAAVQAHDHKDCPLASANAKRDGVDRRHDAVTGVHHEHAVHHFLLTPTGGTIRLDAAGAGPDQARDRIRQHLQVITRSFAEGDFAIPMLIHDEVPPGVDDMKKMKAAIQYEFAPTDKGGEVRISTKDPAALAAVHAFLRYQIEDHGTGDPTE
jgi:hypothetical protein